MSEIWSARASATGPGPGTAYPLTPSLQLWCMSVYLCLSVSLSVSLTKVRLSFVNTSLSTLRSVPYSGNLLCSEYQNQSTCTVLNTMKRREDYSKSVYNSSSLCSFIYAINLGPHHNIRRDSLSKQLWSKYFFYIFNALALLACKLQIIIILITIMPPPSAAAAVSDSSHLAATGTNKWPLLSSVICQIHCSSKC